MSLLKQKKENDRVAAEAAAKAKEEAILRELAIHPVVKAGCGRDVRDAYFHGLVFAAIADDEKVDADERAILDGVAKSMGFKDGDVEEAISLITNMPSPDAKLQLIEECLCAIKDREAIVKIFYAQFAELWMTGEYDLGELKEYAGMFKDSTGIELLPARLKDIKMVLSNSTELNSALDDLAAWMGDDELKHFALHRYGDVSPRIEQSRKDKRDAAEAAKQKQAEEEQRREAGKVSGFFETVAGIVEEMRIVNESRVNSVILKSFRSRLTAKGLETVDTVKAYKAIHDAFVSKADKAAREKGARLGSFSAGLLGTALGASVPGALSAIVNSVAPSELFKSFCQVSWAVIALCILKKDVDSADVSQFNGLLQDAHSHGTKREAHRQANIRYVNDDPNYFWSTYLHERVAKVLGLGCIEEGEAVVEAPQKNIGRGGGEGGMHEKGGRKEVTEQEKRRACKEALYAQWKPFYKATIKSRFLDIEESGLELAGDEAWHDHDTIVSCVESVRDFVWRLDFDLGPLDVKEIWSEELHYMKHRYTTERSVDSWDRTAMFDLFVFLPRIWKLVLLSFIGERKGGSSVHRIDTKYIVLLLRKALENRTWEKWFEDHFRRLNEEWIWVLLTISASTLDLDSALTSDEDDARYCCEGWWD